MIVTLEMPGRGLRSAARARDFGRDSLEGQFAILEALIHVEPIGAPQCRTLAADRSPRPGNPQDMIAGVAKRP